MLSSSLSVLVFEKQKLRNEPLTSATTVPFRFIWGRLSRRPGSHATPGLKFVVRTSGAPAARRFAHAEPIGKLFIGKRASMKA